MTQRPLFMKSLQKVGAIAAIILFLILIGWGAAYFSGKSATTTAYNQLEERVELYKNFLQRELDQIELVSEILAQNPLIQDILTHEVTSSKIGQANLLLRNANQKLKTDTIYLMDQTGLTITSSNFDRPDSFIGKNYAFRPYFKEARTQEQGRFLAIGITSHKLGYYVSKAVYDDLQNFLGVVVIKIDLYKLQRFTKDIEGIFFLTDQRGIIFLSSAKELELKSLKPLSREDRLSITLTRQYPINAIEELKTSHENSMYDGIPVRRIGNEKYFINVHNLENLGWQVWLLSSVRAVENQVILSGIIVVLVGSVTLISFYLLYRRKEDARRFQTVVDNLPSGVTLFDSNLQMLLCNELAKKLLDFPKSLFEKSLPNLEELFRFNAHRGEYGPGDPDEITRDLILRNKKRENHVAERIRPDGTIIEIRGIWLKNGLISTYTDITDRKKAEADAKRTTAYLETLLQNVDLGVTVIDENLNIIFWNNAFFNLLDLPKRLQKPIMKFEDILRYNAVRGEYGPGDPEQHVQMRLQTALKFEPHRFERTRPDGRTLQIIGKPLKVDGQSFGFVSTYVDITEHKEMAERLRALANTDDLTGLNNRRYFTSLLSREIKRCQRNGSPLSLLLFDLDHFKLVNDTHGHHIGDLALKEFARTCRALLRDIDVFGRMGGEEFCIFLPETEYENAFILAERLRKAVENIELKNDEGQLVPIRVSIGISSYDSMMEDRIEDMLQRADKALYRAKNSGRNRIC